MSYLRGQTLSQQQNELRELIEERLPNEETKIRQRIYQWLSDNQYFVENELFYFYFCVAQNLKAISTGLVNSTAALLKKQKQMLVQTEAARQFAFNSVIIAWAIPVVALFGWIVVALVTNQLR